MGTFMLFLLGLAMTASGLFGGHPYGMILGGLIAAASFAWMWIEAFLVFFCPRR